MVNKRIAACDLFDPKQFIEVDPEIMTQRHWRSSSLFVNKTDQQIVAVVAWQSQEGNDFSLNANIVRDVYRSLRKGDLIKAYLVMAVRDSNRVVGQRDLKDAAMDLLIFETRSPHIRGIGYGPYWWVNSEGNVVGESLEARREYIRDLCF